MFELTKLILALRRQDLCYRLNYHQSRYELEFQVWLLTCGRFEYKALQEDPTWLWRLSQPSQKFVGLTRLQELIYLTRPDVQLAFPLPNAVHDYVLWFWSHGVGEHELFPLITPRERVVAQRLARIRENPRRDILTRNLSGFNRYLSETYSQSYSFGVNLIGYAYGQLGIGEDLRQTALALQTAGVPFSVVNFPPGLEVAQNDRSVAKYVVEDGPYAINLFCMTALETGRFYAERGIRQLKGRYNIGYWPWELSNWPDDWKLVFGLVDEVWVSSSHIYDSLSATQSPPFTKPIQLMPLVVEIGSNADDYRSLEARVNTRKKFCLPRAARLFCFSFDINSSIHRKNPGAIVQAFLKAFPKDAYSSRKVGW